MLKRLTNEQILCADVGARGAETRLVLGAARPKETVIQTKWEERKCNDEEGLRVAQIGKGS